MIYLKNLEDETYYQEYQKSFLAQGGELEVLQKVLEVKFTKKIPDPRN